MPSANRLARESSPYLRQHAHNPVDWYPWGDEAIARARQLDRPIFLSVGYSACHWCHVMEHESFENDEIARILNEHFISIKVDREERPDLDQIYMHAVQMISGQGGWPMSVFLTPSLMPFTGGTYFPPEDRYGRPGFKRILLVLVQAWAEKRGDIDRAAADVTHHLQGMGALPATTGPLNADLLRGAKDALARAYDPRHGGFGQAPKFLHTIDIRLLLRLAKRFGDEASSQMARHTLDRMARGGIYDHLGGGFARYSTDDRWLVPHFEKMLYDNALLAVAYLEGYQATGDPLYRRVVEETLGWVGREMTRPDGPFFSTLDADSEGVEGKFYVWTQEEIEAVLGPDAPLFVACYGVKPNGNWTDPHDPATPKNILHLDHPLADLALRYRKSEDELRATLSAGRERLRLEREKRVHPGLDDKTLTSWNGLMITAFATAAAVLDRPEYAETASRAADFILAKMRTPDGRLLRTCSPEGDAKLNGYLEDYAYLLEGLVSLYEATFEPRRLDEARDIARVMLGQFWDAKHGGFFYTGNDHERLIARGKDPHDNATPAANSVAVTALLRLVKLTGDADLLARAETTLGLYAELMASRPFATAQMLIALDYYLGPVQEFAVVGDPQAEDTRRVLRAIRKGFRPHKAVAAGLGDRVPLLAGKAAKDGRVTTYLCVDFACQEPLVGAESLESALGSD